MPSRDLPARPHLDHLKHEAKALLRAVRAGDASARRRVHAAIGDAPDLSLVDAQRVLAREYGFPSWARLRAHVQASRGIDEAVGAFLAAVQEQDAARARLVLAAEPRVARESLHAAAALGDADAVRRLVAADRALVSSRAGEPSAEPLLYLSASPFHGESPARDAGLLASARLLLDAGADPNTRDGRWGVPALYGVTGMRSVLPVARLLLDAGANPTDGESIFHAAEHFHEDALELLLVAGADLDYVGEWGNTALHFLLRWHDLAREPRVRQGLAWLLAHGADPNVPSGAEREPALHVAARRGQPADVVESLVRHGADVTARRGDESSAWRLARRGGFDEIAALLERLGATPEALSPAERLLAACGRGDVDDARRLASPALIAALPPADRLLLPEAAAGRRDATVRAALAAGFPVDATDDGGATALHHAALIGRAPIARLLLDAGADTAIRDREHSSTPLGWACFGADHVADTEGDYAGTVRLLLEAGARPLAGEYVSRQPAIGAELVRFGADGQPPSTP